MARNDANELLEKAAEAIDITPSMHKEATGHYNAVGDFLMDNGIEADVVPIGSIAMGTPTRPIASDEDDYFDIDALVIRTDLEMGACNPHEVREPVEELLVASKLYGDKIESCDECITVKYVLNGKEGGFRIDLDTCVADQVTGSSLALAGKHYPEKAIAIARSSSPKWLGSNPEGLASWFGDKNERFASKGRLARKERLAKSSPDVYASVEDVPDMMDRSSLQRAVQVAKRSRDEYYRRLQVGEKPASCVLTVLFGMIAEEIDEDSSTLDILEAFTSRLKGTRSDARLGIEGIIGRRGAWKLENPVYEENMLEDWNDSDAERFFDWVEELEQGVADLVSGGIRHDAAAEALFGQKTARRLAAVAVPATGAVATTTRPKTVAPHKPWRAR